jgi:predicted amidophosphoribosyltransferase
MTRPRQRLTVVPCVNCGKTTLRWSRLCSACSTLLAANVALDSRSSQAPKPAGQRRYVNTMSMGKRRHDG